MTDFQAFKLGNQELNLLKVSLKCFLKPIPIDRKQISLGKNKFMKIWLDRKYEFTQTEFK